MATITSVIASSAKAAACFPVDARTLVGTDASFPPRRAAPAGGIFPRRPDSRTRDEHWVGRMHRLGSVPIALALAALCLIQIGCSHSKALPDVSKDTYLGPPVALDGSGQSYVVVGKSPSPGWVATLDRVADQYRHKAVFVSLRRPNPAYYYPQVQVEQRIGTSVLTPETVKVYVRILAFDESAGGQPYALAAENKGAPKP